MPLIEVARFDRVMAATIAKSRLTADGIEAVLFDAEMAWDGNPIRLMVLDEDEAEARAILASINQDEI
jgi:hypothetical protein